MEGRIDPLLADAPPRADAAAGGRPPPSGAWRLVAALGICGLAAVVTMAVVGGGDDGDATPATTAVVRASAPASTVAPAATTPSIDAPGSRWWLVNRDRPLPAGYVPADLVVPNAPTEPDAGVVQLTAETAAAFDAMAADATTAGYALQVTSGYRSFEDQQRLHDRFVADYGSDVAAGLVAVPGTSEHQTGLAADVGLVGLPDDQVFGQTEASGWVAANAHRFGFILRYPPDKAAITGYTDEPWHLRYVGVDLATDLHTSGLTMEERFGLVPAPAPG